MKTTGKAILVLTLLMIFIVKNVQSQNPNIDKIDVAKVAVYKKTGTQSNTKPKFYLGSTPSKLIAAFGHPIRIDSLQSELDDLTYTNYHYNGATFTFNGNQFENLQITNSNFCLITNTTIDPNKPFQYHFKVGDGVKKVNSVYPTSYKSRSSTGIGFYFYAVLEKAVKNRDGSTRKVKTTHFLDGGINFTVSENKITQIMAGWD